MSKKKFDIERLINDLGGATATAKAAGVVRTAPYGWVKAGYISSVSLERIKTSHPEIDIDDYFTRISDET